MASWLQGHPYLFVCCCVFVRKTVNESSVMLKKSDLNIEEEALIGAEGKLKKRCARVQCQRVRDAGLLYRH